MTIFVIFFEKNEKNLAIYLEKCQVFGNFLTVKWQFSGGSDCYHAHGLTPLPQTCVATKLTVCEAVYTGNEHVIFSEVP